MVKNINTNAEFKTACQLWVSDEAQAEIEYGKISDWNTSNVTDMAQAFMNAMQQGANLQAVQAIVQTGEAICAGMKADGNIALVHGKIMPNGVLLTVRTKDSGFTRMCFDVCKNAL